jgi:transposase-like protein
MKTVATNTMLPGEPLVGFSGSLQLELAELAAEARERMLAVAVSAGLRVLDAVLAESITAIVGPKGRHLPERTAVRHGTETGAVVLGGRKVAVRRPRARRVDGSGEVNLAVWEQFTATDLLDRLTMEKLLAKVSCRRWHAGLEPVGEAVTATARATSRSAVSRRFVRATETALAELLAADLSGLDLVAVMIDGVHFAGHLCVVALGIDIFGVKHPLALVEGSTENATLVRSLLVDLRDRGLDVTHPMLFVLDGAKALRSAVLEVFDHPIIARCQLHKIRNVEDRLPERLRTTVTSKMRAAYRQPSAIAAEAALEALARDLERSHPGAAGSLREGLAETLTVTRLGITGSLWSTLRSTNAIESMIEICRDHSSNVKRWRDGQMVLRWCAAGMIEAASQFRRVKGYRQLPALRAALNATIINSDTPAAYDQNAA